MADGILESFLGALQASLAVLLTISYGVIASRYGLLKESSSKDISKTCVRLFLPALLITNVGSELKAGTAMRYVPVLMCQVPADKSSLPLVLVQSLDSSGILKQLTMGDDSSSSAVSRAKSYFLVASVVGNCLTFAVGPKLLDDEDSPAEGEHEDNKQNEDGGNNIQAARDEEEATPRNSEGRTAEEEEDYVSESTTLLPDAVARREAHAEEEVLKEAKRLCMKFPGSVQKAFGFVGSLMNAPLIGAIIGAFLGLIPALHKAFFDEPADGGVFKAWLTTSIKNIGELFPALQLVVVGAKLSNSLLKMKRGEASGNVRWIPSLTIFFIRFLLWPVLQNACTRVSIAIIYLVVAKTQWLDDDPILWFVLMLMPTGPPATKLTALADVSGASDEEKMSIAKFITISYAISPVICFAVVASLKASLAAKQS
ncbi:hypothetical protein BP5796_00295 [Coleophoma crateriformis]|uniref:Auxin efflux carrier n=1 Tax=Coleophoma crateriformis TaxID=565419 RepID=A0A3D8T7H2_9HELO|nr:hypothetical protein BP5796_00295 [Coleophoma crateriformis]